MTDHAQKKPPLTTVLPETGFIRLPVLMAITGLSRATIYRRVALGDIPKFIKLGRSTLWSVESVKQWIETLNSEVI